MVPGGRWYWPYVNPDGGTTLGSLTGLIDVRRKVSLITADSKGMVCGSVVAGSSSRLVLSCL